MKTNRILLILIGIVISPLAGLSQGADLATPKVRAEAVTLADHILTTREFGVQPQDLESPFAPADFDQPDAEELLAQQAAAVAAISTTDTNRPRGPRGVLEMLAEKIVPSGILRMGGQAILLFGQKKLKVGDRLTITFDGIDYDLDITQIGSTTFTLRYQGEEIARSIKSGQTP